MSRVARAASLALAAASLESCALPAPAPRASERAFGFYADNAVIFEAVRKGDVALLSRLVDDGAAVDPSDEFGDTPLIYAAMSGRADEARVLLSRGARVNARDSFRQTALIAAAQHGAADVVALLLKRGADVSAQDRFGRDALMYAAIYDSVPVARLLMDAGADPNVRDPWGATALSFAVEHGFNAMVAALLPRARVTPGLIETAKASGQDEIAALLRRAAGLPALAADAPAPVPERLPLPQPAPLPALYSAVDSPPQALPPDPRRFALVIGVERYLRLPAAAYAARDAETMKNYLIAMGYPRENIVTLSGPNATRALFQGYLEEWLPRNLKPDSEFFLYYAGHGAADALTHRSYLVPWDADAEFLDATAYPLDRLYADLARLRSRRIVAALDACFSGMGARSVSPPGRPLVAGVTLGRPLGAARVLAAASGAQIAAVLPGEGHGLFTYYLLQGLRGGAADARGRVTLDGLERFLAPAVAAAAARQNLTQTPLLIPAAGPDELLVRWPRPRR